MSMAEHLVEAGRARVDAECDAAIAAVRRKLAATGGDYCVDCDDPIEIDRRCALPSAVRCIDCQIMHERNGHARQF